MKIIVTVKLVPDTNAEKRIDPGTKRLVRTGIETVLNPFDEYAIEAALQIKEKRSDGSTVTIFSMAPESGKEIVRKALAMGADDAVMLSDPKLEGSDLRGTAFAMAAALKNVGFDLILCGTQSTDAITGEVPGMLAEYLGVPGLTYVRKLDVDGSTVRAQRETDTGYLEVSAATPALVSVTKSINEPRYPSLKGIMGAKKKEIRTLSLDDAGVTQAVGSDGAKTQVLELVSPSVRGKGRVVSVADGAEGAAVIVEFLKEKKLI
ncbi:MAG: electron transfer flavoprotein subunit beta/FixA family protein [Candidatus Eremiobacteraeota bacterium]|nr:electron transfer flavoprotein subunit beta/FixA family protein [Candidatus Eremiobacteraeota bacterium]MBV8354666.1 electron transfer flavoprotein subunit beta/FixA family protein [Candidatus Eremiobacteraeota bacterium]